MVAGDLVNTASRIQSAAEPGTVLRRRGDAAGDRADDRLRGRRASFELKGKEGPTPLWRALRVVSGPPGRAQVAGARGAVRRPRPRAAPDQGPLPRERGRAEGAPRLRHRHRRDRQVAARRGSSTSTSTASPRPSTGTAAAASPTARASPTGRSPTWCGCAAGSPRTRSRRRRCAKLHATLEEHILDAEERRFVEPRLAQLLGLGEHEARDQQDLFAAWRLFFERLAETLSDRARLRGHAVGRRQPARLRRVPARLVAQPPDLRDHARPAGAARAAADLGRRPAQLHLALPRAALAARRWRSSSPGSCRGFPTRCATRSSRAPRASRSTRSRRCACCSTAACSSQDGAVYRLTGPRSRRSRCRRRCTR